MQAQRRTIRKYPNRRLYDTTESCYITLRDIMRLVRDDVDFVVIDRKDERDITRNILLQVITEQEQGIDSMMSREFLSQLIRSHGTPQQQGVASALEQSVRRFG
jgi:polyhydroxyalkanoate synthesis repressor PhaR